MDEFIGKTMRMPRYKKDEVNDDGPIYKEAVVTLNNRWFEEKFKLIIENYKTNSNFIEIPKEQQGHLLQQLMEVIKEANDI